MKDEEPLSPPKVASFNYSPVPVGTRWSELTPEQRKQEYKTYCEWYYNQKI